MECCQIEIFSIVGGSFRAEIFKVKNVEAAYVSS